MADRKVTIQIGAKNGASTVLQKVARDVQKVTRQISRFGKTAGQSLTNAGRSVSSLGRKFTLMGGAALAGFAFATRTFAQFDSNMAAVEAVTGSTAAQMELLRDRAKELGSSTRFSASEAAEGMQMLGQAGFDTQQILAGIGPTLSLAAAGGLELKEAADIASDVSSAFGLSADEIGRVADVIATTATSANTNVSMMGETFSKVAPLAKAAGQSLEETSIAAGILGNSGLKASVAGTDLKIILQSLATESGQNALLDLGVRALDTEGNFRPLIEIMGELGTVTENLPNAERLNLFTNVFGRASKSAVVLADVTDDALGRITTNMDNAEGAAGRMAETMQSSLMGAGVALKSAFEGLQIAIVEAFEGPLTNAAKTITGIVSGLTKWASANKSLVVAIGVGVLAFTAFGVGLMAIGGTMSLAGFAITGLATTIGVLGTAITFLSGPVIAPFVILLASITTAVGLVGGAFAISAYKTGLLSDAFEHANFILKGLFEVFNQTFSGMKDALSSGDLALAGEIAMAGLHLAFWKGLQRIYQSFVMMGPKLWITIQDFLTRWIRATKSTAETVAKMLTAPVGALAGLMANGISGLEFGGSGGGSLGAYFQDQTDIAAKALDDLSKQAAVKAKAATKAAVTGKDPLSPRGGAPANPSIPIGFGSGIPTFDFTAYSAPAPGITGAGVGPLLPGVNGGPVGLTAAPGGGLPAITPSAPGAIQAAESRLMTRGSGRDTGKEILKAAQATNKTLEKIDESIRETAPKAGITMMPGEMIA